MLPPFRRVRYELESKSYHLLLGSEPSFWSHTLSIIFIAESSSTHLGITVMDKIRFQLLLLSKVIKFSVISVTGVTICHSS